MGIIRDDILQAAAVDNERLEILEQSFFSSLFDFVILAGYFRTISLEPKESVQVYFFVFPLLAHA
jgi:hypothetical protein